MKIILFTYCTKKRRGNSTRKDKHTHAQRINEESDCQEQSLTELWRWGVWTWCRRSKASKWLWTREWLGEIILDEISMKKCTFNLSILCCQKLGNGTKQLQKKKLLYPFDENLSQLTCTSSHLSMFCFPLCSSVNAAKTAHGLKLKRLYQWYWKNKVTTRSSPTPIRIFKIWDNIWHSTAWWEGVWGFISCHHQYFVNVQVFVPSFGRTWHCCHTSSFGATCKLSARIWKESRQASCGSNTMPPSPETPSLPRDSFGTYLISFNVLTSNSPVPTVKSKGANFSCHCRIHECTYAMYVQ